MIHGLPMQWQAPLRCQKVSKQPQIIVGLKLGQRRSRAAANSSCLITPNSSDECAYRKALFRLCRDFEECNLINTSAYTPPTY